MSDVVNLNGYDVKDAHARENISNLQNRVTTLENSLSPRRTAQDIITDNNMSGLIYYVVQNGICTVTIVATPKGSYSASTGVTMTTTAPPPVTPYRTTAGRASDKSLLDIYHQGNSIKFTLGSIKSAPNNSYSTQYSYAIAIS